MSIVRAVAVTVLLVGGAVFAAPAAHALNLPANSGLGPPLVEAGPAGHAVVIAGFETTGTSFAAPGGRFGPLIGDASGVVAFAVDAAGETVAVAHSPQAQARMAAFGRPLGSPAMLGATDNARMLVAQDPGGATAVAWSRGGRLQIARRSRLAAFSATVDAGPATAVGGVAITPDGAVHVVATRGATEPPAARVPQAVLVTLRPGGSEPELLELDGVEGLALTRATDGHLLAISRRPSPRDQILVARLLDPAGRRVRDVTINAGSGYPLVLGAILEPGGRAAVAWTVADGDFRPQAAVVAEGDAMSGFGPPRRVNRYGELSDAFLASNARGDAILVWSAGGYRPRAVMRPAGGRFGSTVIVSPHAAWPPTAGVLPDGRALVALTEIDRTEWRHVVVGVGPAGAQTRQILAERRLEVRIAPRARARCRAARRRVIARTRFAVVQRVGPHRREICSLITGETAQLNEGAVFLDSIRLAGPFAAYGVFLQAEENASSDEISVVVEDTRTGQALPALNTYLGEAGPALGDLALAADGAFAVTVCPAAYTYAQTARTRRRCGRRGRVVEVIAIDAPGPEGRRRLARGRTIDPRSLRLHGRTLSWRQGGAMRRATLRRLRLPG